MAMEPNISLTNLKTEELSEKVAIQFQHLIQEYSDIFDWNRTKIGKTDVIAHSILTDPNEYPIKTRPYPLSPGESDFLKKELEYFKKLGIIEKCKVPGLHLFSSLKRKTVNYN